MDYWVLLCLSALAAYALGSVNTAIIVSKAVLKIDIREQGSGNAGTTNALRVMGIKYTVWVVFGDVLKGVLACVIGYLIAGEYGKLVAGTFAVVGHAFPLYFGFKGGKGVLTTCAVAGMIDWRVMAIALSVFILVVAVTRYVSAGSILAALTFFVCTGVFHSWEFGYLTMAFFLTVLIIIMHRQNLVRLFNGEENKLSFKKKAESGSRK